MSDANPPAGIRTTSQPDPDATRVILVRHGQGVVNVSGRIGGHEGCVGLTDLGRSQVAGMATRLEASGELATCDVLVASLLPRAYETALILAPALGIETNAIERDCDLCELHPGEADGMVWADYTNRYTVPDWEVDPSTPLSPGGEGWSGFVDRATRGIEVLAQRHRGQRLVVATHAGVIEATIIRHLIGSPEGAAHRRLRLPTRHASLTEWEISATGWKLHRFNDAAGVPD
ncbi:MAG: histidine phosphatase family protein [Actinomycetes bacterium]